MRGFVDIIVQMDVSIGVHMIEILMVANTVVGMNHIIIQRKDKVA